jgi:hypothetical protein
LAFAWLLSVGSSCHGPDAELEHDAVVGPWEISHGSHIAAMDTARGNMADRAVHAGLYRCHQQHYLRCSGVHLQASSCRRGVSMLSGRTISLIDSILLTQYLYHFHRLLLASHRQLRRPAECEAWPQAGCGGRGIY